MRGYKTIIQEAELMVMPPLAVADFLKKRANQTGSESYWDPVDEASERKLRDRADPLIELSLARYGRHESVISELFQSASDNSPIRLACLANNFRTRRGLFTWFPEKLLNLNPGGMLKWILEASDTEFDALFENPTLNDSFLRDVLERRNELKAITDDRLRHIVWVLHRNPRMLEWRQCDYMEEYYQYDYSDVFNALWKLAETVPANKEWADAIGSLYVELPTYSYSIKTPLKLAERWHVDPSNADAREEHLKNHEWGYLGKMERVRMGLARLALRKDRSLLAELLASDDLAFRVGAYAAGNLTAEQLQAGYEKDRRFAADAGLSNLLLWRNHDTRLALHRIASGYFYDSVLISKEAEVRQNYPRWFLDCEGQ